MTPETLARIHQRAMTVPAPWSAADFASLLAQDTSFLIPSPVSTNPEPGQDLTGFALGRVTLDEAELLTLAVLPDHQRKGVGRACLAGFEAEARQRGARIAFLEVADTNDPARALYDAAAWRETGRRKAYYKAPGARIDAVLMSKTLAAD